MLTWKIAIPDKKATPETRSPGKLLHSIGKTSEGDPEIRNHPLKSYRSVQENKINEERTNATTSNAPTLFNISVINSLITFIFY